MTKTIRNPILPGFHPDPSIVRVGDDYYIANSTFEWWPGVKISHSKDLIHWRTVGYALTRRSQLDMLGIRASGGIWAPCLSHDGEKFYLIYTNMRGSDKGFMDSPNYLVTAESIDGPWSEPVYLNASGFDPSLFHDDDGRKWLINMIWDHRKGKRRFAGIVKQEYCPRQQKLVGEVVNIWRGTEMGGTEGPHLYKRGGYYYLMCAEGGTGYGHGEVMARSSHIDGPYETDPIGHFITAREAPQAALQKTGHGDIVETPDGETYFVHLCGRPIMPQKHCILGRETAIQKCVWSDDRWLRLANGGVVGDLQVPAPNLPEQPFDTPPARDDFDGDNLALCWNTLRLPADESWLSLSERPGWLRLCGRESLHSSHFQSLVARRIEAFNIDASTCVAFDPQTFQQMAGLICYYNERNHFYLRISHDEKLGKSLSIVMTDKSRYDELPEAEVSIEGWDQVYLQARIRRETLQFAYSKEGQTWTDIGPVLDSSKLSDEYAAPMAFTGAYVGMCVQDLSGTKRPADFDWFEYVEVE